MADVWVGDTSKPLPWVYHRDPAGYQRHNDYVHVACHPTESYRVLAGKRWALITEEAAARVGTPCERCYTTLAKCGVCGEPITWKRTEWRPGVFWSKWEHADGVDRHDDPLPDWLGQRPVALKQWLARVP